MEIHKLFRFGSAMAAFRRSRGVAQKALALGAGIDPTRLSALERGRVVGPSTDLALRLSRCLQLSEGETEQLLNAATHDRLMREISRNIPQKRQHLLALTLDAAYVLSQEDCDVLAKTIQHLVGPRQKLAQLSNPEVVAMT